ncbi:MAG: type II toxin-antitoxin system HipA family toxin [Chthoniobacterales bacterium]|nr:type II toxin-antitoxin system HipA family toxin [Chthoniobacterales bacterium]
MQSHLQVHWWDGTLVGHLVHRGTIYFTYDEAWIEQGHDLSPLSLPLTTAAFNGAGLLDGLPGMISDCLPDVWGRKVARRFFAENKWGEPSVLSLLQWRSDRGLGALQFLPPIESKEGKIGTQLKKISTALLARNAEKIERGEPSKVLPQLVEGGTAGGVYPKTLILGYADGTLRVGPPDGEGVPSILKFDLSNKGEHASCEHAYAMMAKAAGINVVTTNLIEEGGIQQRRHLLIKRFDIPDSSDLQCRFHFHSLSGLLHKSPTDLDYQDLFRAALRLKLPLSEIEEIARRLIFNLLASNHDDHGKNHAFLYHEKDRTWHLTPAYDLNYTPGMLERGMSICGEVWPAMNTVEALCVDAGVTQKKFRSLLKEVESGIARWPHFAKKADVSKSMIQEIKQRHELIRDRIIKN